MIQISVSELKVDAGKYVGMAQKQDVLITKNGKVVAKLVTAKVDKVAAVEELISMFPKGTKVDYDTIREEADYIATSDKDILKADGPVPVKTTADILKIMEE